MEQLIVEECYAKEKPFLGRRPASIAAAAES